MSVDSALARLWLRLAKRGERCDLLGLRAENDELVVEVIEVKTSGTGGLEVARAEIDKAHAQLAATLEAVRSGLHEDDEAPDASPLAAPRQEMLKEVFVSGCQSLSATPADRERWAEWLRMLFGEAEGPLATRLGGVIYAVELSNNNPLEEYTLADTDFSVQVRRVREARIQTLISSGNRSDDGTPDRSEPGGGAGPIPRPTPL